MKSASKIFGWYGVVAILGAYFLISIDYLSGDDIVYHLLNLTGATGIAVSSWLKTDWQPVVLNLVFSLIAIIGLVRIIFL